MAALPWRRLLFPTLALGWMGLIFYLSSQSDPLADAPAREAFERAGSRFLAPLAHLVEFAVLALLWRWGLPSRWPRLAVYPAAFALAMAFAVGDEVHQAFTPDRQSSTGDLGIDAGGALAALAFWRAIELFIPRPFFKHGRSSSMEGLPADRRGLL